MNLTQSDFNRKKYARRQNFAKGRDIRTAPEALDELLQLSRDPNPDTRAAAVQYLCPCHVQRNKTEVWDRLLELTKDPELKIRKIVFHILGDGSPTERAHDVIAALESMYHDPDLKFRRTVRKFLAQYRRTGRVNIL